MGTADRLPVDWRVHDERFSTRGDHHVRRLHTGARWLEGPAWSPAWRCLLFSDVPDDRVLRWDEVSGRVDVVQAPSGHANGRTIDRAGRVVTCQQGERRVVRAEHDGGLTVVADRWQGRRFNSPNDVVEHSDGSIWFTDPAYGIDGDYEGRRTEPEIDGCHVYRCAPDGAVHRVVDDMDRPNGLAFSADERTLFVVDTARRHVRRFGVDGDRLRDDGVLVTCDAGSYDGLRLDDLGRLWIAAGDGVHCVDPDGTLLGRLLLPETCSNLEFGGRRRNVLHVTATSSLYAIMLDVGAARSR